MRRHLLLAAAGACFLASAGVAQAHDVTVTCDPASGGYVVQPDYLHLSPSWTFTAGSVVVTWSDGFQLTRLLPGPCVAPAPPPTPVQPEVTPPPTCADLLTRYPLAGPVRRAAWGCPAATPKRPTAKPRPKPRARVITCTFVVRHYRGAARTRMLVRHRLPASCGRPYTPPVTG